MQIIAGEYRHRQLKSPKGQKTRPTSGKLRAAFFNMVQQRIAGSRFLDLFAGSGAMGLEALSRGAASAIFVESDREAARCIKENIEALGVEGRARLLSCDVVKALKLLGENSVDLIYIDPPYDLRIGALSAGEYLLEWLGSRSLLASGGLLFIERSGRDSPLADRSGTLALVEERSYGSTGLAIFRQD